MNLLRFHQKEPDKAYISNRLWLPKLLIRDAWVKKALEFTVPGPDGQQLIKLWDESKYHIVVPREFISSAVYPRYPFPFVDLRPQFMRVRFRDMVQPRNEEQQRAWEALAAHDNGVLNLACGKGKTILAAKKIAQKGVPTLVIVPDGGILDQWRRTICGDPTPGRSTPPRLGFDGDLGIIQGPIFEWARPITLALVTTLWQRIEQGWVPEEMFRYFGLVIYDEVHKIGAPKFSLTAPPWYGDRIGLTATVRRDDGLDNVYLSHIGQPFYSDLSQDLIPRIYVLQTPAVLNVEDTKVNGISSTGKLRSLLGINYSGNVYRYWCIKEQLDQGRKILCLSHSKAQLRLFHAMFPGSGLIIGATPKDQRTDILRNSRITFAIASLGSTGVDDDALDTLFWLTPFNSDNTLQQSMGRIQRARPGKKTPIFIIFEDWFTKTLRKMCAGVRSTLRKWHFQVDTVKPRVLPLALPREEQATYDTEFRRLTADDITAVADDQE